MVVECAYGTDFSEALIKAANREALGHLTPERRKKVRFVVARNEQLIEDVTARAPVEIGDLEASFDLVFGVNTIRYAHRLQNLEECVNGIKQLLRPGGVCIVIDMNAKFPAFRSRLLSRTERENASCYLPTLDEYAAPFEEAGFEIVRKQNFCWIPHSAGAVLTSVMRVLTPALNGLARGRAMRSLVIARKQKPRS
jgi:hypothetical protein